VPYVLPLLAAAFYFNTVRTADGYPPVWTVRASVIPNDMLFEFSVFAGGLAAWAGSREGRRKTIDLVATTPRAAWARLSVALAGTLCWLLLAFLVGVAVLYVQTALQATWGGPPLWPVFVGAAGCSKPGEPRGPGRSARPPTVARGSARAWSSRPACCCSPFAVPAPASATTVKGNPLTRARRRWR
jgi:hypothetical protein